MDYTNKELKRCELLKTAVARSQLTTLAWKHINRAYNTFSRIIRVESVCFVVLLVYKVTIVSSQGYKYRD